MNTTLGAAKENDRFPAPWKAAQMPGGFKVMDASGQVYARETAEAAGIANVLTFDEAWRALPNALSKPLLWDMQ